MGNFSYIAQNSGEPIRNPWHGDEICELQLVEAGKVIEKMRGVYSGYGSVKHDKPFEHHILVNNLWLDITEKTKQRMVKAGCSGDMWLSKEWGDIVDMHFESTSDGVAAWHCDMKELIPYATERSEDDPNQGDNFEDFDDDSEN